ncbi:MAG: small acid-soluble spore protein Tlp [Ruminiclostridium sp.]
MEHTHNPDYREGNQERIKTKINKTMHNSEVADEIINKTDDIRLKNNLIEKNNRRQDAVHKMKREIKED